MLESAGFKGLTKEELASIISKDKLSAARYSRKEITKKEREGDKKYKQQIKEGLENKIEILTYFKINEIYLIIE